MPIVATIGLALIFLGVYLIHRVGGGKIGKMPVVISEDNDWVVITASPPALPMRITIISVIMATALAIFFGVRQSFLNPTSEATPFLAVAVWLVSGILIRKVWQNYHDGRRKVVHFPIMVSPQGIKIGGLVIPPDHIYALTLRNGQDGRVIVVGGHGAVLGVGQIAAQTLSLLTAISYTVEVDHAGTSTVLAGGLTNLQAQAVASEIIKRLPGLSK